MIFHIPCYVLEINIFTAFQHVLYKNLGNTAFVVNPYLWCTKRVKRTDMGRLVFKKNMGRPVVSACFSNIGAPGFMAFLANSSGVCAVFSKWFILRL